jgi:hypothetical protein
LAGSRDAVLGHEDAAGLASSTDFVAEAADLSRADRAPPVLALDDQQLRQMREPASLLLVLEESVDLVRAELVEYVRARASHPRDRLKQMDDKPLERPALHGFVAAVGVREELVHPIAVDLRHRRN